MGRFLRQARLYDDARRANLRADRGSGVALLRRASARWARLSLHCRTAARAAAARVAGARAQPFAGAAYSPPSRAVPVGLQPLQGAGRSAAAGCRVKREPALLTRIVVAVVWILHFVPLILLAPHFVGLDAGCTRLTCEIDMAGIYAKQKDAFFDALLLSGRTRFGHQRAISRQEGVRPALAALKEGIPFYYLPDQDYGPRDAIFVPFFAASAATITGLSRMTRLTGARIVPCVTRMLPGDAGYELRCYPVWENFPGEDDAADARRMNAFIEERVREMPEQYFWTHKRFKTRPEGEPKWY